MDGIVSKLLGASEKFNAKQVADTVELLIGHGAQHGASDIHIEPLERLVLVRYRIDGRLRGVHKLPKAAAPTIARHIKKLAQLNASDRRLPQEGQFTQQVGSRLYMVRVATMPVVSGEKIVLHLSASDEKPRSLDELGFWGDALLGLQQSLRQPHGLVLVAGPKHAGKATTLHSLLHLLNSPVVSIATLEDPLERQLPGVSHTSVQQNLGMTFARALTAALKQDPDVIMLSNLPDSETIELAVSAAQHGHVVLAALHADSATHALIHLRLLGVPPFLLQHTVKAVVGQRLVRTLCPHCRQRVALGVEQRDELEHAFGIATSTAHARVHQLEQQAAGEGLGKGLEPNSTLRHITHLWEPSTEGCTACDHTGFKGRTALVEVFVPSPATQRALSSATSTAQLQTAAVKDNFVPLMLDGLVKALRGQTTISEVLRAAPRA